MNPVGKKRLARLSQRLLSTKSSKAIKEQMAEKLKADREQCDKERNDAYESLNKDQAEYDKQLLALSGAFLALSLAFIKDVVPLPQAIHLWELYLSFGMMVACIFLVLASFQYSIHGHFRVMRFWELKEEFLLTEETNQTTINAKMTVLHGHIAKHGKRIRCANVASGVLFFGGVCILVLFVISNIRMESRVLPDTSNAIREGQSMSSASPPRPVPPASPVPSPGSYPKPPK